VITNAALARTAARTSEATLREVVEALAPLEREAGTEGERQSAEWIAARLEAAGASSARVEEEQFHDGFGGILAKLAAGAAASGLLAMSRRTRKLGAIGAVAAGALIADDISNGARPFRKAVNPARPTWNAVAEIGDPDAERTLVVLSHHDAARSGAIFDQTLQRELGERFPGIIERIDTSLPQWWLVLAGPAAVVAGAATGNRKLALAGSVISTSSAGFLAEIQSNGVVPGANDNLSAVAAQIALAETLRERPVEGLRVVIASCGAEEVLQGGIYGFCERHLAGADRDNTWLLNLDSVGSPSLVMLEGEGCVVMEDYFDRTWRDLIWRVAERDGIPMRRDMRSRASTDSVIPSRMGIATACITSLDRYKAISNYHHPDDTPDRLSWPTIACAADLAEAVARELAITAAPARRAE